MKYVAFLDILGFKNMVEQISHDVLSRVYDNAFVMSAGMALSGGRYVTVETPQGPIAQADLREAKVSSLVVSDSIVLWTKDDSTKSFVEMCKTVGCLIVSGMYTGLPMRGTIAHGELTAMSHSSGPQSALNVQTVFGRALVDAYAEESKHEWAGCVVTDSCIDCYNAHIERLSDTRPDIATIDYLLEKDILRRHHVMEKEGATRERWVVNWPRFNKSGVSGKVVHKAFTMHGKLIDDERVKRKLENTIAFIV